MKTTSYLYFLICLFLLPGTTQANHIISGDVFSTCLSPGNYEQTFRMFLDCDGGGAPFDDPMVCTIYRGNAEPYVEVVTLDIDLTSQVNPVPSTLDDCLTQTAGCLERGEYIFTQDLPISDESYHFVYQRCCGVENLLNLVDTLIGLTVVFELTPEAQQACNNSPVLTENSFLEVCKGKSFAFNLTAFDDDGDDLMYEWCAPILGGGNLGTPDMPGDPKVCNGVAPDPACPPPFEVAAFLSGFTVDQPLGATSSIQLNPNTGEMVGIAETPGRYITALCVSEFRDNVLLSRQQINVSFLVHDPTATTTISIAPLAIYPNPASEEVLVVLPEGIGEYELFVRDVAGRLVMKQSAGLSGATVHLNLRDWNAGMYWVEVQSEKGRRIGKLIVR